MQYTIRQVPTTVDRALRSKAKAEGKSLNQIAIEALALRAGVASAVTKPKRDLSFLRATPEDIRAIEEAHAWFDSLDRES
jgi:hypothetical protein